MDKTLIVSRKEKPPEFLHQTPPQPTPKKPVPQNENAKPGHAKDVAIRIFVGLAQRDIEKMMASGDPCHFKTLALLAVQAADTILKQVYHVSKNGEDHG